MPERRAVNGPRDVPGEERPPRPRHPFFAMAYDVLLRGLATQLDPWRRRVCGGAQGRVLELGAGTGLNLPFYDWDAVSELVLLEPDPFMVARLSRRMKAHVRRGRPLRLLEAPAEAIPVEDATFDAVIAVHVFCTVARPERAAIEVVRVLAPGGELRVLEHVQGETARVRKIQDWVTPVWRRIGAGCHPNRETAGVLAAAGLEWVTLERFPLVGALLPARPHIFGVAVCR